MARRAARPCARAPHGVGPGGGPRHGGVDPHRRARSLVARADELEYSLRMGLDGEADQLALIAARSCCVGEPRRHGPAGETAQSGEAGQGRGGAVAAAAARGAGRAGLERRRPEARRGTNQGLTTCTPGSRRSAASTSRAPSSGTAAAWPPGALALEDGGPPGLRVVRARPRARRPGHPGPATARRGDRGRPGRAAPARSGRPPAWRAGRPHRPHSWAAPAAARSGSPRRSTSCRPGSAREPRWWPTSPSPGGWPGSSSPTPTPLSSTSATLSALRTGWTRSRPTSTWRPRAATGPMAAAIRAACTAASQVARLLVAPVLPLVGDRGWCSPRPAASPGRRGPCSPASSAGRSPSRRRHPLARSGDRSPPRAARRLVAGPHVDRGAEEVSAPRSVAGAAASRDGAAREQRLGPGRRPRRAGRRAAPRRSRPPLRREPALLRRRAGRRPWFGYDIDQLAHTPDRGAVGLRARPGLGALRRGGGRR